MAENSGNPSGPSFLKRKRQATAEERRFSANTHSASTNPRSAEERSTSPKDTAMMMADEDMRDFVSRSQKLFELSAYDEFTEHLSLTVDQMIHPETLITPKVLANALHQLLPYNRNLPTQILDVINQYWFDQAVDVKPSLTALLQALINANIVSTSHAIELVDRDILQDSTVISNSQVLTTRSVRINTGLLYKQQKYNLLREENEGYAKLSHEFNVGLSELPKGGFVDGIEIEAKSKELLTVVNALIGYFELDPNRVLDNILDICSQNLLSHARFILYFLHHSPWAPASLAVSPPFASLDESEKRSRLDSIRVDFCGHFKAEMNRNGGSRLAAQLLGFKLRYFALGGESQERIHPSPESLIFLTALLIKTGFVRLSDIYPYLSPSDVTLNEEYKKWKQDMDEKAFMAKSNPLALAGALGDGENGDAQKPQPAEPRETKIVENTKVAEMSQKASLLHALLAVGGLPSAIQLLSLHPQISAPHPSISEGIHRILHVSIQPIYAPFSPARHFDKRIVDGLESQKKRAAATRTATGNVEWLDDLERKSVRGYNPFPKQEFADRIVRFFLDNDLWADDIPICQTVDDFYSIAFNLLRFSGPRLGNDVSLLVKLARIGKGQFLNPERPTSHLRRWVDIARSCLIPAISLVGPNPGVVNEIYELLRYFPFTTRFSIYGEWQSVAYKIHPELKLKASETDKETKGILRRISKQDVKRFGRALAKTSTSNPLILWAIAINQIENYDNFVEVVVDAAKFCTHLGYDALEFVILSSLANPFKNRVKEDGTSVAIWLTGLSAFCAKVFRRYAYMDVSTVTTYVACQLKNSNIYDLVVLRDLVAQMGGVLVRENLSDHQLRCYSGGDSLKEQAMSLLREPGTLLGWKKSSSRLLKALTDTNLAGLLVILIAQERGSSLFNLKIEHISNLKLLGNLFDECHGVLVQFHEFIVSNLDVLSFEKLLPPFEKMVEDYGIETPVSFYLWRPILAEKIRQHDVDLSIQLQKKKLLEGLAANDKSGIAQEDSADSLTSAMDTEVPDVSPDGSASMILDSGEAKEEHSGMQSPSKLEEPWHPALREFINAARRVVADEVWTYMSPHFYTTFWQLNLYDISVPMQAYTQEVSKLTSEIKKKDADRTDVSPLAIQRRRRERERLQALVDQLNQEFKVQTAVYQATKKRLAKEKDYWFDWANLSSTSEAIPPRNKTVLSILQHCIIPRCLFGPNEAIFSAKFVREMHRLGTKNFSSLTLFDKIFVSVHETVIFTCTNREAENYARFLREVLVELTRWYSDKAIYDKEAIGPSIPGFLKKWSSNPAEAVYLQHEEFRSVMFKWHKNMTTAFRNCLESRDYMHVRNALAVLEKIVSQYPQVDFHGVSIEEKVNVIAAKTETRGDLQVRAQGYLALLRKSSKTWVTAAKFSTQSKGGPSPAYSPNLRRPSTPQAPAAPQTTALVSSTDRQSLQSKSNLNPNATSFQPQGDGSRRSDEKSSEGPDGSLLRPSRGVDMAQIEAGILSKSRIGEFQHSTSERASRREDSSPRTSSQTPTDKLLDSRDGIDKSRGEVPLKEDSERRSRTSRPYDQSQRKMDGTKSERLSRSSEDSTHPPIETLPSRQVNNGPENQMNFTSRVERSTKLRDDSQDDVNDTDQISRISSSISSQPRDNAVNRPRTPEGPRVSADTFRNNAGPPRSPAPRDFHAGRSLPYDSRPHSNINIRGHPGFRAPTGPRGASVVGQSNSGPVPRAQTGRPSLVESTREGPFGTSSSAPLEKTESLSSANLPLGMNSDRIAVQGISSQDNQTDHSAHQRSAVAPDLRANKSRASHIDIASPAIRREPGQSSDVPRGPAEWRRRDLQDDDPRRLSKWADGSEDSSQPNTTSGITARSMSISKSTESGKEHASEKTRILREKEREHSDSQRPSRDGRQERDKSESGDNRRTRARSRSDLADREASARGAGASNQSERVKPTEQTPPNSRSTRDTKEPSTRERKDDQSTERKSTHREKPEALPREQRDKDQKIGRRDDDSRRREEREIADRNNRREESRDNRHEHPRESHHGRSAYRRSPSGTHSDRSEKKDREREGERRDGGRRESRHSDHREKERPTRDLEPRRDVRERDRPGRERESENRVGSRKHERDKSAEGVERTMRPGDSPGGGDPALPTKRRKVLR